MTIQNPLLVINGGNTKSFILNYQANINNSLRRIEKMNETKRFHCGECDYYWEITNKSFNPRCCPKCSGIKIHRSTGDRRYSRKARQKVRWSNSSSIRR